MGLEPDEVSEPIAEPARTFVEISVEMLPRGTRLKTARKESLVRSYSNRPCIGGTTSTVTGALS